MEHVRRFSQVLIESSVRNEVVVVKRGPWGVMDDDLPRLMRLYGRQLEVAFADVFKDAIST